MPNIKRISTWGKVILMVIKELPGQTLVKLEGAKLELELKIIVRKGNLILVSIVSYLQMKMRSNLTYKLAGFVSSLITLISVIHFPRIF